MHFSITFFLRACAVLFLVLHSFSAAQKVTSVTCLGPNSSAPFCISGATIKVTFDSDVTIDSKNSLMLNEVNKVTCQAPKYSPTVLSCMLNYDNSLLAGEYAINVTISSSAGAATPVDAGYLLIGPFYEQTSMKLWSMHEKLPSQYLVASQSAEWPSTNDTWLIYGNFKAGGSYKVIFYNEETNITGPSPGMPSCDVKSVTANTISCTLTCNQNMMGMYHFLVNDTTVGAILPGSTRLSSIAINPPLPSVQKVEGDCAKSSTKCLTGATLSFTGTMFNTRSPSFNNIYINATSKSTKSLNCTVTSISTTVLMCTLTVDATTVPPGTYAVYANVQVCNMGMLSPSVKLGYLVLGGGGSSSGWLDASGTAAGKADDVITAVAPTTLSVNNTLTLLGSFDPTAQYSVVFSQTLPVAASLVPAAVTCNRTTVDSSRVVCTYASSASYKKLDYYVLVQNKNSGNFVGNGSRVASTIATLYPANITVNQVDGDCAKQSDKCIYGAELQLTVKGVASGMPTDWVKVALSNPADGNCVVKNVTATTITCQLQLRSGGLVGGYPLTISQRVSDQEWLDPVTAGFLVFGAGASRPGWLATASDFVVVEEHDIIKKANKAAIAFAVIFAVLFLGVLIGLIVMCCKMRMMKRRVKEFVPDTLMYTDRNSVS